jgi:Zn-dependent protease with chaperone function
MAKNSNRDAGGGTLTDSALFAPLDDAIEPVRTTVGYRLASLLVALVMILLPLIYFAMIAGVGWLVYWHLTHNHVIFEGGGNDKGKVFVYLTPAAVGIVAILFMIKPLFAPAPRKSKPVSLSREREPRLFEFVERLCRNVGAPVPRRIDVDNEVNASASFRNGMASMVIGNDLVLTIGMPLAAGLSMRQFAGVLAHEFGHFSQGAGMRLSFIVRSISFWFARLVYERDGWDQWLETMQSATGFNGVSIAVAIARLFVWLSRRVLWVLMMIGNAVSCLLLRQMEYDADRHEARLAGSDTFESTVHRLRELGLAQQGAMSDLQNAMRENQLADDFAALTIANVDYFKRRPEVLESISKASLESKTGWFDTHPADGDRVTSARAERAPGVFRLDAPASELFSNFAKTSKALTVRWYREVLDREVKPEELVPSSRIAEAQNAIVSANEALLRFLQAMIPVSTLPWLPAADEAQPSEATRESMEAARKEVIEAAEAIRARVSKETEPLARRIRRDDSTVLRLEIALARRIGLGMARLEDDSLIAELGLDRESLEKLVAIVGCLKSAGERRDAIHRVRSGFEEQAQLFERLQASSEVSPADLEKLQAGGKEMHTALLDLVEALRGIDYPFDHSERGIDLSRYAIENVPPATELGDLMGTAGRALDQLSHLQIRMLGRLAELAERVESAAGIEPLAMPKRAEEPR